MFDPAEISAAPFVAVSDEARLELLNRQLAYAAAHSPYYRQALQGLGLPLQNLDQLTRLPFLDAPAMRRAGSALACVPGSQVERIVSLQTSGTTGGAKRLYFTRGDLDRTVEFFAQGMSWMCRAGDRVAILMPCRAPDGIGDLLSRSLGQIGAEPLPIGIPADLSALAEDLRRAPPQVLVGFPWQLRLLALLCPDLRPRAVLLSGDYVPAALPPVLESLWQCRVLLHFGMTETGYGCAVEHPGGTGMYLRRDELLAEVIDPDSGAPLPAGSVGELVLTTLRREAMPLLRYRTGDLASLTPEGNLARVCGRRAVPRAVYWLQEALCPLPWLWDYTLEGDSLLAALSPEAPADAVARLSAAAGMPVTGLLLPPDRARLFAPGKRGLS